MKKRGGDWSSSTEYPMRSLPCDACPESYRRADNTYQNTQAAGTNEEPSPKHKRMKGPAGTQKVCKEEIVIGKKI